jgi:hypothetical protein
MSVNMDVDVNKCGYGYSVWYVPKNYKSLQHTYNIPHIPHITLETNLCLRDAYHVYHNASKTIKIKFQDKYIKFPSFYEYDPMISYGWHVDVVSMTRRKLNWLPHMTLRYEPRTCKTNTYRDKVILAENHLPPTNQIDCDIVIADTRSGIPQEWHTKHTYFNIKISHSNSISFGLNGKLNPISSTSIDEYFGSCIEEFSEFKKTLCNELYNRGFRINDKDYANLLKAIEKELSNVSQEMEIDNLLPYKMK